MASGGKRKRYSRQETIDILMQDSDSDGNGLSSDENDVYEDDDYNIDDEINPQTGEIRSDSDTDVEGPLPLNDLNNNNVNGPDRNLHHQVPEVVQRMQRHQAPHVPLNRRRQLQDNPEFRWEYYLWEDPYVPDWMPAFQCRRAGVLVDTQGYQPVDYFKIFFPDEAFEMLSVETNRYAMQVLDNPIPLARHSRYNKWIDTDISEIKAYIALQIAMGLCSKPELEDYWGKFWLSSVPFGDIMSRNRYELLTSFLHFTNNETDRPQRGEPDYDPLWKIRDLLDMCESKYIEAYSPSKELSIDESIVRFKGRVHFRQYLPSKPYRWGIKQFVQCESSTGYALKFITYCGKGTIDLRPGFTMTETLCLDLLEGFERKGHEVYTDNFYTSPNLYIELQRKGVGACGTVKAGRKNMPHVMKPNVLHLKKGDDPVFVRLDNLVTCAWHDTKRVHFLSTIDTNNTVDKRIRSKDGEGGYRNIEKPVVAERYNASMGGVDLLDQKLLTYSFPHKSSKWYYTIYHRLREVAIVNAHVLYSKNVANPVSARVFREQIINGLLEGFERKAARRGRPSDLALPARLTERHFVGQFGDPTYKPDCIVCSSRTERGWKRKQTNYKCIQCNLPMCLLPCHEIYHTRQNFRQAAAARVHNI